MTDSFLFLISAQSELHIVSRRESAGLCYAAGFTIPAQFAVPQKPEKGDGIM